MESFISSKDLLKRLDVKGFIAILLAAILLMGVGFTAAKKEVIIVCDGQETKVSTYAKTVGEVLESQDIEIIAEDKVIPGLDEKLEKNTTIVVEKAFEITLIDGDKEQNITTTEKTIRNLLKTLNIELAEEDRIEPAIDSNLLPGDKIKITRITSETLVEEHEIPFQTTIKHNDNMDHGKTKKIQDGETGIKEVQFKVTYEDGVEIEREIIEEKVIKEATNEIIEKGTARYLVTSRGSKPRKYKDVMIMEATAYTADYASTGKKPGDKYFGITASGTKARPGVVAVDPRVIPMGTKLYIESMDGTASYGNATAEDTGGAIKGKKIDLFFPTSQEVKQFGRRNVKVYILD